jgi:hypothetical protein
VVALLAIPGFVRLWVANFQKLWYGVKPSPISHPADLGETRSGQKIEVESRVAQNVPVLHSPFFKGPRSRLYLDVFSNGQII